MIKMKYKFYTKEENNGIMEHYIDAPSCKQAYEKLRKDYEHFNISLTGWR